MGKREGKRVLPIPHGPFVRILPASPHRIVSPLPPVSAGTIHGSTSGFINWGKRVPVHCRFYAHSNASWKTVTKTFQSTGVIFTTVPNILMPSHSNIEEAVCRPPPASFLGGCGISWHYSEARNLW